MKQPYTVDFDPRKGYPTSFNISVEPEYIGDVGDMDWSIAGRRLFNKEAEGIGIVPTKLVLPSENALLLKDNCLESEVVTSLDATYCLGVVSAIGLNVRSYLGNEQDLPFSFFYWPPSTPSFGSYGFDLSLREDLVKGALDMEVDCNAHEDYSKDVVKVLWGKKRASMYLYEKLNFEGGFLKNITVPGDACGLDVEMGWRNHSVAKLSPHNVDSPRQAIALFAIANNWLNDIIPRIDLE